MPDIKTALSTVLSAWEQDEQKQINQEKPLSKQLFKTTNNVSRETFNFIKANPNKTTAEVANALEKRGFKESSVTSICAQMSKQGMVTKDMYTKRLVALVPEYVPLKTASAFKSGKPTLKAVKQAPQNAGIASIAPQDKPELKVPTSIVLTRNWHPHDIVNKLSVMQARELYDLLKEIFKG